MAIDIVNQREEWITEWKNQVNNNSDYHETGEGWGEGFNGDFVFEVEVDGEYEEALQHTDDDIENGVAFFTEVSDGEVHSGTDIDIDETEDYDYGFKLFAPYSNWKGLIKQEFGPIDGLMGGQLELDGDMQKVLQYSDGAVSLASAAGQVDTEFPEE